MNSIFAFWQTVLDSSPELSEIRETGSSHPNDEVLIGHIVPLNILPSKTTWGILDILKFVLDVRRPCNTGLNNSNGGTLLIFEIIGIIEHTLCNKTAWNCWSACVQRFFTNALLLVVPKIANSDNWIAVSELFYWQVVTVELGAVSRFDVPSVVLVEVVQLIVDIHWSFNIIRDLFKFNWAIPLLSIWVVLRLQIFLAFLVVLSRALENLFAKYVEYNTNG